MISPADTAYPVLTASPPATELTEAYSPDPYEPPPPMPWGRAGEFGKGPHPQEAPVRRDRIKLKRLELA
jgi:hypothetical protein